MDVGHISNIGHMISVQYTDMFAAMIGENRQLVTNEPVEFEE